MAVENQIYLATFDIAQRAGVIESAYVTKDGKFVLDVMELKRIRLSADEFVHGLDGIVPVDSKTAKLLISENQYRRYSDMKSEEE